MIKTTNPSLVSSGYVQHLRDLIASVSSYPVANPHPIVNPSQSTSPERREQQRILLPYKQALMVES